MKPHKHAELIKAWADGAEIQYNHYCVWKDAPDPAWNEDTEYRIKPEPKPDFYRHYRITKDNCVYPRGFEIDSDANLIILFDGESGKPKSAEVLK